MTAAVDFAAVRACIDRVEDPEVPVTLTDLGVVRAVEVDGDQVRVVLRPTRLACPARDEMMRRVRAAVHEAAPNARVEVSWEMASWQPESVSSDGARDLLQIGYAHPLDTYPRCPFCGSAQVRRGGMFGGSVCKVPFSCRSCGSTFDGLKSAGRGQPTEES